MFHNEIKEGAIFVADAHINEKRDNFLKFLQSIKEEEIKTSQLFLMGDIFDLLVGNVKYTYKTNQKYIDLINKISKKIKKE
jgi:UDP-2,3-diacylglucosamine hydrolase